MKRRSNSAGAKRTSQLSRKESEDSLPPTDLDRLMTITEGADWLRMARKTLLNNIRRKRIPCVRINDRSVRIHPRTVLAALA